MFCFKCGRQIKDDSAFCQYCGSKQNNAASITTKQSTAVSTASSSGELDREALKIYLGNILSLECIKANYERKINNLRYNIRQYSDSTYIKRYVLRKGKNIWKEYCVHFMYNGQLCLAWFKSGSHGPWHENKLSGFVSDYQYEWVSIDEDSDIDFLKKASQWDNFDDYDCGYFTKLAQREEARDAFFRAYADFKATAPEIYRNSVATNTKSVNNWNQQIKGMSNELESIKRLLQQAYDVNIIPTQFRYKIHAIYYLHDFVSTSRESLTTALLHFDLDEIKAKLDQIIEQQESIIIQNAVMIAQNDKLAKQNQQQLERLSKIESNTNQAAQYAKIAANNAETCAWISMANYIEAH